MNLTLLREVYRRHRVRKKKYRWYKVAKDADEDTRWLDLVGMKRQLTMARNDGYRIVYLEKTMFTRKTVADTEWSLPGQNKWIYEALLNEPTLALLTEVSNERDMNTSRSTTIR